MNETPPSSRVTLELELEPEGESEAPAGALITPRGERRPFIGWLELASAIEDWRQTQERAGPTTDSSTVPEQAENELAAEATTSTADG